MVSPAVNALRPENGSFGRLIAFARFFDRHGVCLSKFASSPSSPSSPKCWEGLYCVRGSSLSIGCDLAYAAASAGVAAPVEALGDQRHGFAASGTRRCRRCGIGFAPSLRRLSLPISFNFCFQVLFFLLTLKRTWFQGSA